MSYLKVHTAQNVVLDFPVANVGQRILAALLDFIFCAIYVWIAYQIFSALLNIDILADASRITFWVVVIAPVTLYLPFIEYLWKGKTLGKAIMKMQVVRVDGSSPSLGDIILRWLVRTIDVKLGFLMIFFVPRTPSNSAEEMFMVWAMILWLLPMPIVGIISMATSKIGQRIGDRIANTTVIKSTNVFSLEDTILKATEINYEPRYLNVLDLRDKDIRIIKETVETAEKTRQYKNVKILADKARERLKIEDDIRDLMLLKTLVKDYNHLAREKELNID